METSKRVVVVKISSASCCNRLLLIMINFIGKTKKVWAFGVEKCG